MFLSPLLHDGSPLRRAGESLLNMTLLLGLAAVLAYWTWRLAAPAATSMFQPRTQQVAAFDPTALKGLFGGRAEAGDARATSLNIHLTGVFAAPGGRPAVAILKVNGQDMAVVRGSEVQTGVVLDTVEPDHVLLLNQGVKERLDLDQPGGRAGGTQGARQDVALGAREIDQVIANPQDIRAQVRPVGDEERPGLLLVQVEPGGFAERLGLRNGDILRMVNGHAVGSLQDLGRLLTDAAGTSRVSLVGEREAKPLILSYRLQP